MGQKITKIKLSDGQIYGIFDTGALRLNEDGILVTGNEVVDNLVLVGKLKIEEVDDVPVEEAISNVLTQNTLTGEIKKRDTDYLLKDIGGITYDEQPLDEGILSLHIGK